MGSPIEARPLFVVVRVGPLPAQLAFVKSLRQMGLRLAFWRLRQKRRRMSQVVALFPPLPRSTSVAEGLR